MFGKIVKYGASFVRVVFLKLRFGSKIQIDFKNGKPIYIGNHCIFKIKSNGKLILHSGVYFDDYSKVEVCKEASVEIGNNVYFNNFCRIISMKRIVIGSNCMFGANVSIYDHDHDFSNGVLNASKCYACDDVIMENEVWCCSNVVITKGSVIQQNSVIGANAIVSGKLEINGLYVGIPAKRIKSIYKEGKR